MHTAWDKGLGLFSGASFHLSLPLTADNYAFLSQKSNEYRTTVNAGTVDLYFSPTNWAGDSFYIAKAGYDGVQKDTPLSEEYKQKHRPEIQKQILRGGKRLAHTLTKILGY